MLFSFVTPELILAVALFLMFINVFDVIGLGTLFQLIGLVVLAMAYAVVIVRARLLSLGNSYEEAAMDLGASPVRTLGRITILLMPSIFASAAIVFAITLDDFVVVNQLSRMPRARRSRSRSTVLRRTSPTPATNAIGTLMLVTSTIIIVIAAVAYRRAARRRGEGAPEALAG